MPETVLTINAGSSSIKFALYRLVGDGGLALACRGEIEGIGTEPHFSASDGEGRPLPVPQEEGAARTHEALLDGLLGWLEAQAAEARIIAAGHRVVHGGTRFAAPVRIDEDVLCALEALAPLAPLHQPHNTKAIRALQAARPELPQVACFDTAFHRGRSAAAERFALPRHFAEEGVLRYGFHGLSYEYIARTLPRIAPEIAAGRVVVAHLGNGASLCAIDKGRSVDTTMAFTPLDGLVMGTRCGALDPGVVLHLLRQRGIDAAAIEDMLWHHSGLLGVSGISNDMRALLASDKPQAGEAVEMFVFRAVREIGGLAASLGGLDGLVFTAGIGENAPQVRARICARLGFLGIRLDAEANRRGGPRISRPDSPASAWAIATDEEAMIAEHALAVVSAAAEDQEDRWEDR